MNRYRTGFQQREPTAACHRDGRKQNGVGQPAPKPMRQANLQYPFTQSWNVSEWFLIQANLQYRFTESRNVS
jgi:hypothetical protein